MKRSSTYLFICITLILSSYGPSDEEVLMEAEFTVQSFADELNMQNFNSAKEIYPDLSEISKYNVLKNFSIKSSKFADNSKNQIKIIADYGVNENLKPIQFILNKNDESSFKIISSKGLSSYYKSRLFNIMKISGCLSDIESDASIHRDCKKMAPKFENLVQQYKEHIQKSITLEKIGSSLNLSGYYIKNISGDLMLKNNSEISIPGFSYEIYIMLLDGNKNVIHSSKYEFNSSPIMANQNHQIRVFSIDYQRSFNSYGAIVQITNDQFIRNYLESKGKLDCSIL